MRAWGRNRGKVIAGLIMVMGAIAIATLIRPAKLNADNDDAKRAVTDSTRWRVHEQDWAGEWVRRPGTNTFDARWVTPGQPEIRGVINMRWDGRDVVVQRTDLYTNQHCEYRGRVSGDGQSANGWLRCNDGLRVNWTADIFYGGSFPGGHMEVPGPRSDDFGRSQGPIVPRYNQNLNNWRYDLTGVWRCNDNGTYYVRQLGNNVWWYGESSDGQWSNIFHGALDGNWLEGFWLDVPKGRDQDHGALRLQVDSLNEFHRVDKSGDDFGGSRWRRVR